MSEALTIANIRRWLGNPIVRAVLNNSVEKGKRGKPSRIRYGTSGLQHKVKHHL